MTLLDSLLDAILRLDGEALVMHAGEKPYVVLTSASVSRFRGPLAWGQVELSSRPLTSETVLGMLGQMLSPEQSHALEEFGAIEHEIDAPGDAGERFVVTAARGGEDVWVEVRRRSKVVPPAATGDVTEHAADISDIRTSPQQERIPEPGPAVQPAAEADLAGEQDVELHEVEEDLSAIVDAAAGSTPVFELSSSPAFDARSEAVRVDDEREHEATVFDIEPGPFELDGEAPVFEITSTATAAATREPAAGESSDAAFPTAPAASAPLLGFDEVEDELVLLDLDHTDDVTSDVSAAPLALEDAAAHTRGIDAPAVSQEPAPEAEQPDSIATEPAAAPEAVLAPASTGAAAAQDERPAEPEPQPVSVVVPHARPTFKLHQAPPAAPSAAASTEASLVEVLRVAAAQRASTVYAVVDTRPMMRIEGRIALVGTHPSIQAGDVERFIFEYAPHDRVADPDPEWTCAVPGAGRVRCVTFHDQSGAGLILHLPAGDASTADELAVPADVQALCGEADGLIVVAGPRSSGKSTLLGAFVDLINRTRYDHVITIESQIRKVHEKRLSFISQREVRGDGEAIAAAARAALREGPDVLVIEDLRAPEALVAALDAARAGRLVFGSISARTAPAAVERLLDAFPEDRRPQLRASLAGSLRAVVAQLLVPRSTGGRIAAREVLFSSPAVRKLILDGAIEQLPIAIESGRGLGMRTMVDSLGTLVRDGVVDIGEACACAPDRAALVAALERDGIDVSGVERRA